MITCDNCRYLTDEIEAPCLPKRVCGLLPHPGNEIVIDGVLPKEEEDGQDDGGDEDEEETT